MKNILSSGALRKCSRFVSVTLLIAGFLIAPYHIISAPFPEIGAVLGRSQASAAVSLPFLYTFNSAGTLYEASSMDKSTSQYLWLSRGAKLVIDGSVGSTIQGALPQGDPWRTVYAARSSASTDGGTHPQNLFLMFSRISVQNVSAQVYIKRVADNLANTTNRQPYIGEMLLARYKDANNYYYGGIRADGYAVIKKKTNGVYQTLAMKKLFPGTYNSSTSYDLMPRGTWIGLRFTVTDTASGAPQLTFATDIGQTGSWQTALSVLDDPAKFGSSVAGAGLVGIESDYADAQLDNFRIADATATVTLPSTTTATTTTTPPAPSVSYDSAVATDAPVMYLTMGSPSSGTERDQTGRGNNGTYKGGIPLSAKLPNGDTAAAFNGSGQYLTVPSSPALSIPTTKKLTWEAWIRPDTLQFPNSNGGDVDWMGEGANYSPTCEWEARIYNLTNPENRPNRLSAYVFNPSAGLGSAADWQPKAGLLQAGQWLHIVAEYDLTTTPAGCNSAYPGSIHIWVNGVKWSMADHMPTGCMSQFSVVPRAGSSPLNIGTMALDTWFKGAIGKVAVYNYLLSPTQITNHFKTMAGAAPSGSCGATCTIPVPTP